MEAQRYEFPRMPFDVRALNRFGPLASRLGLTPKVGAFEPDALIDDARRATGLDDLGPADFLPALERLARALDREARLGFHGRRAVRGALIGALKNRLYLERNARQEPRIEQQPIERPVFIIGLLRTGSTLLHNLLAQHPKLRVPLLWELATPASPVPGLAGDAALVDATQAYVDEYYRMAPRLPSVHFIDARRPDECHRLLGNTFASMVYQMRYDVPSYAEWLAGHDSGAAYLYHRRQLQHLLWRRPGGPVVLKCPFHVWTLPHLLAAYPDARLVHLHRDPAKVIPSTCSLCQVVRGARAERVDLHGIGRAWLEWIEAGLERARRFDRAAWPRARFLDVRYHDLVGDTLGQMEQICEFAGAPLDDQARAAMRAWLATNGQERHGRHRYSAAQFGLEPGELRERFADYRREQRLDDER